MKPDDFEQKLERQTLRELPSGWREEILAAAHSASRPTPHAPRLHWNWLSTLLWPNQRAWAGLAAVWLLIFAVNFFIRDEPVVIAQKASQSSAETIWVLRQQNFLLAESVKSRETPATEEPRRFSPKPHSERRDEILKA